jgi:hypothetical protein
MRWPSCVYCCVSLSWLILLPWLIFQRKVKQLTLVTKPLTVEVQAKMLRTDTEAEGISGR